MTFTEAAGLRHRTNDLVGLLHALRCLSYGTYRMAYIDEGVYIDATTGKYYVVRKDGTRVQR